MELIEDGQLCFWAGKLGEMLNKKCEIYRVPDPSTGCGQYFPPRYLLYVDSEEICDQTYGIQYQRFLWWLRGYYDATKERQELT
tara:strand:+ start:384 stop:635 length:252 start_codon:yes stop_codon:yes gene_type:complete